MRWWSPCLIPVTKSICVTCYAPPFTFRMVIFIPYLLFSDDNKILTAPLSHRSICTVITQCLGSWILCGSYRAKETYLWQKETEIKISAEILWSLNFGQNSLSSRNFGKIAWSDTWKQLRKLPIRKGGEAGRCDK